MCALAGRGGPCAAALRHGLDSHALGRLVRCGRCTPLTRGWYAVTDPPHAPLAPEERHRLTAVALGRQFLRQRVLDALRLAA